MIQFAAVLGVIPSIMGWYRAKQEAQMVWYKIIWEAICNITKFIWNNFWLVVKIIAVLYVLLQWYGAVNERNAEHELRLAADNALAEHIEFDAMAQRYRSEELKMLAEKGKKEAADRDAVHKYDLAQIIIHSKQKEAQYETDKKLTDARLIAYRDGLSLAVQRQAASSATERLPSNEQDRLTSRDNHTTVPEQLQEAQDALDVCQEAGAMAAADYNLARDYILSEQKRLGVEP
jgi:hypothetical protein